MPKYKVQTDQGNFLVELDKEPSSDQELHDLVNQHFSGGSDTQSQQPQGPGMAARLTSQIGRPVLELGGMVGGAALGAAGGPIGGVAGAGLGYAAGGAGADLLDTALGISKPGTATEEAMKPISRTLEGVGMEMGGRAIGKGLEAASGPLKKSAENVYSRVIGPTTKENKVLTQKVVPELIDRGVTAITRSGLEDKAMGMAGAADTVLEDAYANLPQTAKVKFIPVLQQLENAKKSLVVEGTNTVVRKDLYKAIEKVQNTVLEIAGGAGDIAPTNPEVSVATARSARQQYDAAVKSKTKLFGITGKEAVKVAADKEAGNAIRNELAQEFPDIASINKEFNLWQTVKELMGETNLRTASQSTPLTQQLVTHAGATVGGAAGGGLPGAVIGGVAGRSLGKLFTSPAWRTVDSITRDRLANLLAKGQQAQAGYLAAQILARQPGQQDQGNQ